MEIRYRSFRANFTYDVIPIALFEAQIYVTLANEVLMKNSHLSNLRGTVPVLIPHLYRYRYGTSTTSTVGSYRYWYWYRHTVCVLSARKEECASSCIEALKPLPPFCRMGFKASYLRA